MSYKVYIQIKKAFFPVTLTIFKMGDLEKCIYNTQIKMTFFFQHFNDVSSVGYYNYAYLKMEERNQELLCRKSGGIKCAFFVSIRQKCFERFVENEAYV